MTSHFHSCTFLLIICVIFVASISNLQHIDSLAPSRSIYQVLGDFRKEYTNSWESKVLKFLVQNQNFPKILRHLETKHSIKGNKYYKSCEKKMSTFFPNILATRLVRFHLFFCTSWRQDLR